LSQKPRRRKRERKKSQRFSKIAMVGFSRPQRKKKILYPLTAMEE